MKLEEKDYTPGPEIALALFVPTLVVIALVRHWLFGG